MALLRVLQVSDLHAGTRDEPEVENDLRALVAELAPELVVASGRLWIHTTGGLGLVVRLGSLINRSPS